MKNFYKIVVSVVLLIVLIFGTIKIIPHFSLKASNIESEKIDDTKIATTGKIKIKDGEVLLSETQTKKLYLDTDTLDIRVVDKRNNKQWTSKIEKPSNTREKSIVTISYLSEDKKTQYWEAYDDVIQKDNYEINKIKNGAKLVLNFETATKKADQLIPSFISKEDINTQFYDVIKKMVKDGDMEEKDGKLYKNILDRAYVPSIAKGGYILPDDVLPPSALKSLNEFVKIIGYTEEKLLADNEKTGLHIEIPQIASFRIVINVYLDGDDLVIDVPVEECTSGSKSFEIQTLEVYPSFGYVSSEDADSGYILVPEGGGALFKLNSYNSMYPPYSRAVYNNTYYNDIYEMNKFKEDINMPVFGITYGEGGKDTHGLLGIIENGGELSKINVQLGTKDISTGGNINNKVYPTVDIMQYSRVKLMGPYSENESRYVATTGKFDMNYTVRYKLINEDATYFSMAKIYKQYLMEKYGLEEKYLNEPKIYISILGALTLQGIILGTPYDKIETMTTYEEANEIVRDLGDMNVVYNYENAFLGGEQTKIPKKVDIVKQNGKESELDALFEVIKEQGNEMFLGTNLLTVIDKNYQFNPKIHSVYNYDGKPVHLFKYNYVNGQMWGNNPPKYITHPKFFEDIVSNLIDGTKKYNNIYINDVPNTYYASYKQGEILSPIQANAIIEKELKRLKGEKTLAFNNPNANVLPYCDYAVNISRESSNYGSIYTNIPFRQLVMNGMFEYTTLDANMSKENLNYFLLQALEVGSYPKFTIGAKGQDMLKDVKKMNPYTNYLSVKYDDIRPRIDELYGKYVEEFKKIKTNEIKNHTMLGVGVFETEYKSGTKVIVNYNKYPVDIKGKTIDAVGYIIVD